MSRIYIYLAGPITGYAQENLPAFLKAAEWLFARGYYPVVPHYVPAYEHDGECPEADTYPGVTGEGHAGLCHLRSDLIAMLNCDGVLALPGWELSRGATVEVDLARKLGIPVGRWEEVSATEDVT